MQLIYDLVSVDDEGLVSGLYKEISDCAARNAEVDTKVDINLIESLN